MNIRESILLGLANLRVNPLRSCLTILGVIIGVAAVISVVAFGEGNREKIELEIAKMGSDVFWITSKHEKIDFSDYEQMMKFRGRRSLTMEDIESLRKYGTKINAIAPAIRSSYTVHFKGRRNMFDFIGTEPDYYRIRKIKLERGRFLNKYDILHHRKVCVVERSRSSNKVFGPIDLLGQNISAQGMKFEVVGMTQEKEVTIGSGPFGSIYIPITVMQSLKHANTIDNLYCQSSDSKIVEVAMHQTEDILKSRYRGKDFFEARNMAAWKRSSQRLSRTATMVTTGIAAISLLVGGIGIMNIMLVSVSERTREIGIRKATGARKRDIRRQFLIEASSLSSVGGCMGIILGVILAHLFSPVIKIPVLISPISISIGFFFSVGVGMISGSYPAFKASRLDPIEALRFE